MTIEEQDNGTGGMPSMDTQIVPRAGRPRTASTQGEQHPEGFNLLRIAAAVGVIVGHAFLLSRPASQFVALHFTDANFYLGRLSVGVFFAISGYLITASWYAGPQVRRFAVKRVRRIYPALAVMVVVVTFVVGPIVTAVPDYFGRAGTWSYLARNLLVIPYDYRLPGVFTDNPIHFVNGVLWTLSLEVCCYVLIAVLGRFNLLQRWWVTAGGAAFFLLLGWDAVTARISPSLTANTGEVSAMIGVFLVGSLLRTVDFRGGLGWATGSVGAVALTQIHPLPVSIVGTVAFPVFAISVGRMSLQWARALTRLGDPSYGIYIWGYVIQQTLVHAAGGHLSLAWFLTWSLLLSTAAGYVSWHVVERRWLSPRRTAMAT